MPSRRLWRGDVQLRRGQLAKQTSVGVRLRVKLAKCRFLLKAKISSDPLELHKVGSTLARKPASPPEVPRHCRSIRDFRVAPSI
jgi:hypothetical protein